ncbi:MULTISPECIES: DUF7716 domain-containing protein [Pseudomonas syringae group]|uniref:DUF7716 domain-containing protein n=3 Tax=Pseudomonas syringae group TaxID=136849 RepID=A0AAD0E0Z8_9PSED|nr:MULTISPECIES: hypothetical protein [Pseudomonas syringae group]AVB21600.1 hypothetical protein BKM03_22135 [Pseudomonas avellanae]EGH14482.1 hypothetical protein PSYMP_27803 [Pseudomonas amygdali pv. morsprunorum str. M302280]KWS73512.1 hypothetical protein AL055_00015 [Pseudomonas amygdali pv. morsprunorum]PHN49766.1 hypothetical protein AO261_26135 [Pseudomonas avellanae]POC81818.1 hypothetical protein BKM26_28210 [Pseudomonas avellanae]
MKNVTTGKPIVIADLINFLKSGPAMIDDLCLYTDEDVEAITPETICYLDRYPEVVNDEEVYSEFVTANELELLYYGQQFNDVLANIYSQDKTADMGTVIHALNYYLGNDDFLDIV